MFVNMNTYLIILYLMFKNRREKQADTPIYA